MPEQKGYSPEHEPSRLKDVLINRWTGLLAILGATGITIALESGRPETTPTQQGHEFNLSPDDLENLSEADLQAGAKVLETITATIQDKRVKTSSDSLIIDELLPGSSELIISLASLPTDVRKKIRIDGMEVVATRDENGSITLISNDTYYEILKKPMSPDQQQALDTASEKFRSGIAGNLAKTGSKLERITPWTYMVTNESIRRKNSFDEFYIKIQVQPDGHILLTENHGEMAGNTVEAKSQTEAEEFLKQILEQ